MFPHEFARERNNNIIIQFYFETFAYNNHTQQISMVTLYGLGVISLGLHQGKCSSH